MKTQTTLDAWDSIQDDLPRLRREVYGFVGSKGTEGATHREVCEHFGMERSFTYGPRCTELYQLGLLIRTGERRKSPATGRSGWVLVTTEVATSMASEEPE